MRIFSKRKRPVDLGGYPFERLPRRSIGSVPLPQGEHTSPAVPESPYGAVALEYLRLFDQHRDGEIAARPAPVDTAPEALTRVLKSTAYFLDAHAVGTTADAIVVLVAFAREPEADNLASAWVAGGQELQAAVRAAEIACILAGYIRLLGYSATAHTATASEVPIHRLGVEAGLVVPGRDTVEHPYFGASFSMAAVTTGLDLAPDRPLDPGISVRGTSGKDRRPSHLGAYPMETIRRVSRPTTLILGDEVPQVPLRAQFFNRARRGDLGGRAQKESNRFATKHPLAHAMRPMFRDLVPFQGGSVRSDREPDGGSAADNARAVKSLGYYLGADAVSICEIPRYARYSHDRNGERIEPYHRFAVVMLIDQGHDTMEAASGDDWMSGAQSMRAYFRGAEVAGQMAGLVRRLGHSARSQTNLDSDVLHIPLILLAGLGELSRIGELVLHPFLGARFKSVVVTTDLPLEVDEPIDFGLQDTCSQCFKCARECPVSAISYADKVMFNGYEIWKPDVERCTRYRVTNPNGSACGRCMKVCPYTNEGLLAHRLLLQVAIRFPWARRPLVWLDDAVGHGNRNLVKKWWHDLEVRDGLAVRPSGVSERDIDVERLYRIETKPPISYHHASMMPPPDLATPRPLDRRAALDAAALVESPEEALERRRRGDPTPQHYRTSPQK